MAADCNDYSSKELMGGHSHLFQEALYPPFLLQSSTLQPLVVPHGEFSLLFSLVCGLENSFFSAFIPRTRLKSRRQGPGFIAHACVLTVQSKHHYENLWFVDLCGFFGQTFSPPPFFLNGNKFLIIKIIHG